jgi:hypothetical protein
VVKYKVAVIVFLATSIVSGPAVAQDKAAAKTRARGGFALQLDVSSGGDEITSNSVPPYTVESTLGDGMTLSLGGFYRLSESKPWELQSFIGYKRAWIVPVRGGGYDDVISSWVFQLLANYRYENRWYFGGGLTFHGNPRYENTAPDVPARSFDSGVGVTVEGGWSWLGVQCTYIEYGSLDASNCGVRFTWRFRKWRPLN